MDEEEIERNAKCKVEGARFLGGPRNDRGAEGARFLVVGLARNDRRKGVGMKELTVLGGMVGGYVVLAAVLFGAAVAVCNWLRRR